MNNIWRNLNSQFKENELGFYTFETFNKVPSVPGVYAWFYPLRIHTKNIDEYIKNINSILDYDSSCLGKPEVSNVLKLNWDNIAIKASVLTKDSDLTSFKGIWERFCQDDIKFEQLRKIMMRASTFLPPLYVGKASNLNTRCYQHINGKKGNNDFHNRFQNFAKQENLPIKKISDLLFVCIKTDETEEESERSEELVEAILKIFSKPKYSKQ